MKRVLCSCLFSCTCFKMMMTMMTIHDEFEKSLKSPQGCEIEIVRDMIFEIALQKNEQVKKIIIHKNSSIFRRSAPPHPPYLL